MTRRLFTIAVIALTFGCGASLAQDRQYTKADFINIEGGNLNEKIERAFKQFKSSGPGDSLWIAYHFPAGEGSWYGPFTGMVYYDDGIRLERKDNPATAAVFLLTDASGPRASVTRIKTLDLGEPYVFEKRPVYWLGNVDGAQSIQFLEATLRADKENRELVRGAIRAIAGHDNSRVVPLLKELASKETITDLRTSAVSNLSRVKNDQGVEALIDLYENSNLDSVKEEVIKGLGRNDNRKAAEKLLAIAKNDPNPKLRQLAVRRLSQNRSSGVWFN